MFTSQQKHEISVKVQAILQKIANEELPSGEVKFILHVDGAEGWSWANIRNESDRDIDVPPVLIQNLSA